MPKNRSNSPLRRFHAQGNQANRTGDRRKVQENAVWGTLEALGARTAGEKNRLMEARRFARLCDQKELDYLCGLGRAGWKISPTHVLQLIRVKNRQQRMSLAARCATNTWSTRELQREIDRRGLHRQYGGRRRKRPKSFDDALVITDRLLCQLVRWAETFSTVEREANKPHRGRKRKPTRRRRVSATSRPEEIRAKFSKISVAASSLCTIIRSELAARGSASQ